MSTDIIQATKDAVFKAIVQKMIAGASKKDACAEMGISTRTFDRYAAQNPDAVKEIAEMSNAVLRERLSDMVEARTDLLDRIISISLESQSHELSLKELMALEARLTQRIKEVGGESSPKEVGKAVATIARAAASFLDKQPQLVKVSKPPEVIEGETLPVAPGTTGGASTPTVDKTPSLDNRDSVS